MTTLMGLNFTVIKIDGLPLLRNIEILRGSTFRFFCRFCGWETEMKTTDAIYFYRHKDKSHKSSSSSNTSNAFRSCSKSIILRHYKRKEHCS